MGRRAEIIKLEWMLLPTGGAVLARALRLLEERGFDAALAYLEGVAARAGGADQTGRARAAREGRDAADCWKVTAEDGNDVD